MPLIKNILQQDLDKAFNPENPKFSGFPSSLEESATIWSNAVFKYSSTVAPPTTTASAAKSTMFTILNQISKTSSDVGIFQSAFLQYATILGSGMLPAFQGIPNPSPLPISPVILIGFSGGSHSETINQVSSAIDTWFKLSTAVNPITGVTIQWS